MSDAYTETPVHFKAHDDKTIHADLVRAAGKRLDALIIYAHGLPSSRSDFTYLNSARLFARRGFDCLRLSFYSWEKGARCLTECTLDTHRRDLETAVKKYKRTYKSIFIIGHSWGGLTTLHSACKDVSAVSLWEPSYASAEWWPGFTRPHKGLMIAKGDCEFLLHPRMVKQALALDRKACCKLSEKFPVPMQVLLGGAQPFLLKLGESFDKHCTAPTDSHVVKEADHQFLAEAAQKKAVALTARWFLKHV